MVTIFITTVIIAGLVIGSATERANRAEKQLVKLLTMLDSEGRGQEALEVIRFKRR